MGALDHLIRDYSEPIKDPVWNNILLSPGLLRVVALPAFQKLNGIRQLGRLTWSTRGPPTPA
jgi:HD superfamily phosphohydrolase